jgi:hypothetical protein
MEDSIQIACVTWFSLQYRELSRLLHHSPNGGKRNAREAKRFKDMGTRPGFPDLVLLYPASGYSLLAIEMKSPSGTQSEHQKEYQRLMEATGAKYVVCRSFDAFRKEIREYLKF